MLKEVERKMGLKENQFVIEYTNVAHYHSLSDEFF